VLCRERRAELSRLLAPCGRQRAQVVGVAGRGLGMADQEESH